MKEKKVILSGGGTGGHLYPALALGQKLHEQDFRVQLIFIGSERDFEKKIMDKYGANFIPLKIEGIKGKGLKSIKSFFLLPLSFIKSLAILLRVKPDLVIGMGGYSSGPIVLAASLMKFPTLILEQNLYPGFTNRVLVRWVRKAVVSFENSLPFFKGKGVFLGNPVREEFYSLPPKQRNNKLTLLIFGGSQGSHFLNQAVVATLPLLKKEKDTLRVFHQTGNADFEWVKSGYIRNEFRDVVVSPYFFDMSSYFQKSDLIISRAGATTIAELIASRKASLLVPFARASENHQLRNARELEKIQGAEVLREEDFSPERLAERILFFLKNKDKITEMEKNLEPLKKERVADRIVSLCFELMERRS